ncbi:MAG: MFS transporter [Lysobacterales bacterium]|nr:MAG: MFS transporter [Xanthomonadales bacterium]
MDVRRPIWIHRVRAQGAEAFALLFALESLARALIVSIIPVEALHLLGNAQRVSTLFFLVAIFGILATLTVPWMVRKTARRWIYSLGALCLASAPLVMWEGSLSALALGMTLRVIGVVTLTVCLSLYILDHVARHAFNRSEPMRIFYSATAWMVGPALGAWLSTRFGLWAAYLASSLAVLSLLAYFWFLRIRDVAPLTSFRSHSVGPLAHLARFRRQPRLVLAWTAAVGRYMWWVMFFVYVPIYVVAAGYGQMAAGLLVSAGSGLLFFLPLFGLYVRQHGIRRVMIAGFTLSGAFTLLFALATPLPWMALALVLAATLAMVSLDAVSNLPFMLAVRRHERAEMTAVYSTYRDVGEIGAPGVFALLLKFFALPVVFAVTGAAMLGLAALSKSVHPRLGRVAPRPVEPVRLGTEAA